MGVQDSWLFRGLSVSVMGNSHGTGEFMEKEKRTPKVNKYYRNPDFVLRKDKFPPPESNKKPRSKGVGIYEYVAQAFKNCSNFLAKLMKHKHEIANLLVGTPLPDAMWHTFSDDMWHVFSSGLLPSGFPQEYTWRASPIRTSSGRSTRHSQISHPDDRHITSRRPTYPIRICLFGSLTEVSQSCTSS